MSSFADKIKALVKHPAAKPAPVDKSGPTEAGIKLDERTLRPADGPVDIAKLARQALRKKREGCEHEWVPGKRYTFVRNGETFTGRGEVCKHCRDHFPCTGLTCFHLDCIEAGYELGRPGFPRNIDRNVYSIATHKGHRHGDDCPACAIHPEEHYDYNVTFYEAPETWITKIPLEPKP